MDGKVSLFIKPHLIPTCPVPFFAFISFSIFVSTVNREPLELISVVQTRKGLKVARSEAAERDEVRRVKVKYVISSLFAGTQIDAKAQSWPERVNVLMGSAISSLRDAMYSK